MLQGKHNFIELFKDFLINVKKAINYIKLGDILQVVLSQRWKLEFKNHPFSFYRALRKTNPSPYMFYFNFKDFQIVGASPEILVKVSKNKVTIRPIAGTRPRGRNLKEDRYYEKELLKDPKENAEHLMFWPPLPLCVAWCRGGVDTFCITSA